MSVALIIGVGEAVGRASAEKFIAAGYKVAVASRSQRLDPAKFPFFKFDAAEPTHVAPLFEKVSKEVGVPSVVIYNGMCQFGLTVAFKILPRLFDSLSVL